jgi:glycosyltransferase involved in cell wall biosynthesis
VSRLLGAPGVIRLDWQPDETVAALIAGAHALLMPSLDEGFGLPAIEAMAAGVPAMVADRGAQSEIAGDAALRVDPFDIGAIAAGIARIDRDAALRERLVVRGNTRSNQFGIEPFAARLRALYQTIFLGDSGPA